VVGLEFRLQPAQKQRSPKGRCSGAGIKADALMTSIYLELETEPLRRPFRGFLQSRPLNPGLAPWAVLLDPFGVLGFAPETSQALEKNGNRSFRIGPQGRGLKEEI